MWWLDKTFIRHSLSYLGMSVTEAVCDIQRFARRLPPFQVLSIRGAIRFLIHFQSQPSAAGSAPHDLLVCCIQGSPNRQHHHKGVSRQKKSHSAKALSAHATHRSQRNVMQNTREEQSTQRISDRMMLRTLLACDGPAPAVLSLLLVCFLLAGTILSSSKSFGALSDKVSPSFS